jgi:glycerol uptake facilitator-like aquaporin
VATGFYSSLWNSINIVFRTIWRATSQLFHEATGALFAMFAVYGAVAAYREWHSRPAAWLVGFTVVFAITMLIFAFTSFRRSRRIR